jgi:hypothetical protein
MCNRVVQNDIIVKPGERAKVLMRGPGGEFEVLAHGHRSRKRSSAGQPKRKAGACALPSIRHLTPALSPFEAERETREARRMRWCRTSRASEKHGRDALLRVPMFGRRSSARPTTNVPPGSALEGLLLPQSPGKDYRLLKIVTQVLPHGHKPREVTRISVQHSRAVEVHLGSSGIRVGKQHGAGGVRDDEERDPVLR